MARSTWFFPRPDGGGESHISRVPPVTGRLLIKEPLEPSEGAASSGEAGTESGQLDLQNGLLGLGRGQVGGSP